MYVNTLSYAIFIRYSNRWTILEKVTAVTAFDFFALHLSTLTRHCHVLNFDTFYIDPS